MGWQGDGWNHTLASAGCPLSGRSRASARASAERPRVRGFPGQAAGDVVHVRCNRGAGPLGQTVETESALPHGIPRAEDRPAHRAGREVLEQMRSQDVDRVAPGGVTLTRRPAVLVTLYGSVITVLQRAAS